MDSESLEPIEYRLESIVAKLERMANTLIQTFADNEVPPNRAVMIMVMVMETIRRDNDIPSEIFWKDIKSKGLAVAIIGDENEQH
jgi:hypothetical protein